MSKECVPRLSLLHILLLTTPRRAVRLTGVRASCLVNLSKSHEEVPQRECRRIACPDLHSCTFYCSLHLPDDIFPQAELVIV